VQFDALCSSMRKSKKHQNRAGQIPFVSSAAPGVPSIIDTGGLAKNRSRRAPWAEIGWNEATAAFLPVGGSTAAHPAAARRSRPKHHLARQAPTVKPWRSAQVGQLENHQMHRRWRGWSGAWAPKRRSRGSSASQGSKESIPPQERSWNLAFASSQPPPPGMMLCREAAIRATASDIEIPGDPADTSFSDGEQRDFVAWPVRSYRRVRRVCMPSATSISDNIAQLTVSSFLHRRQPT
jgi:hypothetical protein